MFNKPTNKQCLGLALLALSITQANTVLAQQEGDEERILRVEEIVVQGSIGYRNRREDAMATLEYGQDYIQRFEPLTAGDALKRMPSVTFLSDVLESDGVRLRGLDPGYTKILINGEQVPGTSADRSFFMDRIPAELIERVEIVRSNSARRSGDAVAGTLNIVLRDGYSLDGGYIRAGGLRFDDGEWKESAAGVWGGEVGGGRLIVGANLQGRYNPKLKSSLRFGDSPENNAAFATEDFDNREDQTDIRDGTDISFNTTYQVNLTPNTELDLSAFYVDTDRTETERSYEYDSRTAITGPVPAGNLLTDNDNINEIDQSNYSLRARLDTESDMGETSFKVTFASNEQNEYETEDDLNFDRSTPRYTGDLTQVGIVDEELAFDLQHEFDLGNNMAFAVGGFWQAKDRDTDIREQRNRFNVPSAPRDWNQFQRNPKEFRTAWTNLQPIAGGFSTIEEDRLDVFGALEGAGDRIAWEMGLRWESTDVTINDKEIPRTQNTDYDFLLPSAHIRYDLTNADRLTGSIARTVRRPSFDFVSPALLEAELGDNDLLGNPLLDPESAWGYDIGYEHRIGSAGVVGLNYFWRDVSDLIEVANTGIEGSEGPGTSIYTPRNTGDGEVSGIELDLTTPLTAFGMENTGVFLNYSWLDSDVTDEFGPRTFNNQSEFVYNVGFIQDLPAMQAAFGATYRKQDDAYERVTAEEVTTSYGAEMELFVEKSFGERITVRLVGSNLLDGSKDEVFNKFDTTGDQISRDFDEYELESESAGPWYQLMVRIAL